MESMEVAGGTRHDYRIWFVSNINSYIDYQRIIIGATGKMQQALAAVTRASSDLESSKQVKARTKKLFISIVFSEIYERLKTLKNWQRQLMNRANNNFTVSRE